LTDRRKTEILKRLICFSAIGLQTSDISLVIESGPPACILPPVVVIVEWDPESGCTAAYRLIVHTPCAFNVPTFTARRLHITTALEILAAKSGTLLVEKRPVIWPKVASSTLL
jgi:hypothetical protein